ncbi:MAG TPA: hypothetical protein VFS00_11530, partial [Polyangiaceae bacterium]|nr:hypothetical protein [Polyangiaceae bacterium]
MFGTIVRFELASWLRRPLAWLFFAVLLLMAFLSVASGAAVKVGGTGPIHRNAPFVAANAMAVLTSFGQIITTAVAGTAVLRDAQAGAHELLFTTRLRKADYLAGRFVGAFLVTLCLYAALPLGLLLGGLMPWLPAESLGPARPWHVLQPFLTIALPNLLFVSGLLFAVGALTRKLFAVYVTGMALVLAVQLAREATADLDAQTVAALADPFALTAIDVATRYWSAGEKNALVVPFAGPVLQNRLLWTAAAGALFAAVYATFRLGLPAGPRARPPAASPAAPPAPPAARFPTPRHDGPALRAMFAVAARFHFRSIVREAPFLAIASICLMNLLGATWFRLHPLDSALWPVTATLGPIIGDTGHLMLLVIATLYGGELVWRERQLRADLIHDALPAPAWVTLGGKAAALSLALAALLVAMTAGAMLSQAAQGYFAFQPGLYAQIVGLTVLPTAVTLALLATGVHALVDQKFVGHLVLVGYYVLVQAASSVGFDHRLYQVGFLPLYTYSDMNGWGPYLPRVLAQQAYGLAVGGLVALAGYLALARGPAGGRGGRGVRARQAAERLRGGAWAPGAALALAAVVSGGYFYWNANVRNAFTEVRSAEARVAAFERQYKKYEDAPQPRVTGVDLRLDFFPERRAAAWRGTLTAVNRHDAPVDTLYVRLPDALPRPLSPYEAAAGTGVALDSLDFGREAALEHDDTPQGVRIYKLARPLAPGESLRVAFAGRFEPRGFPN